jgi:hypothetical protein
VITRLVDEVRWHRTLFARLYHAIPDVRGTEELQAELGASTDRDLRRQTAQPSFSWLIP